MEHKLKKYEVINEVINEVKYILWIFKETYFGDNMDNLQILLDLNFEGDNKIINVHSKQFF